MKIQKVCAICLTMATAFCSSMCTMNTQADTIDMPDAVRALWAEYGISQDDLQNAASGINRSGYYIEDYALRYNCTVTPSSPQYANFTAEYDTTNISYFGYIASANVTSASSNQSGNIVTYAVNTSVTSAGRVISFLASRTSSQNDVGNYITINCMTDAAITAIDDGWIPVGDVNGDDIVDVSDAMAISFFAAEMSPGQPFHLACADVNLDGVINMTDANLVYQYIIKTNDHVWG